MNYYRRFPGDYLRDTRRLNLLQHGAYTLLLDELYSTEQRIPTAEDAIRICQAITEEEKWAVHSVLDNFFKKTVSGFTNNRYEKELKTRKDWCKWQKNHRDRKPDKSLTVRPMSSRSPSPLPSPSKEREEKPKTTYIPAKPGFRPPSQEEVCGYMKQRNIQDAEGQAERFLAHHSNRKWRLSGGKGPVMEDWRKAVITWEGNIGKFGGGNGARSTNATGTGISRAEQRLAESERQSEQIFGRTSGLVGALRADVQRQPNGGGGPRLPRNSETATRDTGNSAPSVLDGSAGVGRVPPKAGAHLPDRGKPLAETPADARPEPAKVP